MTKPIVVSIALFLAAGPMVPAAPPQPAATQPAQHQIDLLIVELGDPNPQTREAATAALKSMGNPALSALKEASNSPNLEIRSRAQALVKKIEHKGLPGGPLAPQQAHPLSLAIFGRTIVANDGTREVHIYPRPDGLKMTVTAQEDGQAVSQTYRAHSLEQLKQEDPDAAALYERCQDWASGGPNNVVVQGGAGVVRLQGAVVHVQGAIDTLRQELEEAVAKAKLPGPQREAIWDDLDTLEDLQRASRLETPQETDERLQALFSASDRLRDRIANLNVDADEVLPPPAKARLGVQIQMTLFGNPPEAHIVINQVVSGSRAEKIGLKDRDILLKVGGKEVGTQPELRQALVDAKSPLVIECIRDGKAIELTEKDPKKSKP